MRIRARWHAVGILLVALAAPRVAHAGGGRTDTLRRAVANVLLAPLDVALSPVVTVQALYDNAKAANYSEMPVGLTLLVSKSFTDWQPAPFDSIITGVNSGKYEIGVSSFSIKPDRKAQANMVSYYSAGTQTMLGESVLRVPDE